MKRIDLFLKSSLVFVIGYNSIFGNSLLADVKQDVSLWRIIGELQPYFPVVNSHDIPCDQYSDSSKLADTSFIDMVFKESFFDRMSKKDQEQINLYFNKYDVSQINLFNLLATKVPQVSITTEIANSLILSKFDDGDTIVDLGIGTGRQIIALLDSLKDRKATSLKIVGIEPDIGSLNIAEKLIIQKGIALGIDITFVSIHSTAEKMSDVQWDKLGRGFILNASFALHHVKDSIRGRTEILREISERSPKLVVLSEPNVDHFTDEYMVRFSNCYEHFKVTFESIDVLDISENEKAALKRNFFGREINDILGTGERNERHELTTSWLDRLNKANMNPNRSVIEFTHKNLKIVNNEGFYSIEYKEVPLISVIHFK